MKKRELWGLRNLAYRVKKNRKGHYVLFNIDAPAEAVAEYERNMRFNEDVLRYMTVRVKELEEGPSVAAPVATVATVADPVVIAATAATAAATIVKRAILKTKETTNGY